MPVTLLGWKPIAKGALRGVASVQIGQLIIRDIQLLQQGPARPWVGLPSKPRIDASGVVQRDAKGKMLYNPVLEWGSRDAAARFCAGVLAALEAVHPGITQ